MLPLHPVQVINTEFLTACLDSQLGSPRRCIPLVFHRSCPATCSPYIFANTFCHEFSTRPRCSPRFYDTPVRSSGKLRPLRLRTTRLKSQRHELQFSLTIADPLPPFNRTPRLPKPFVYRISETDDLFSWRAASSTYHENFIFKSFLSFAFARCINVVSVV